MQPRTDQVRQPGTYIDMGITSRRIVPDHEADYALHNAEGIIILERAQRLVCHVDMALNLPIVEVFIGHFYPA